MAKPKLNVPLGASLVVLSSVFYASYGIWTTLMGNFFGGYMASAVRSVLVLVLLVPVVMVAGGLGRFDWRRNWRYFAGAAGASLVIWGPFYFAILHAGVGVALTVNYAASIVGMFFFGWLVIGERFTKDKWLATVLSFVGLYLIFSPSVSRLGWVALAAACLSGFAFALNGVMVKQVPLGVLESTVFLWLASLLANTVMVLVLGERLPTVGWYGPWIYLTVFAALSVVASLLYIKGVKLVEAGVAGILGLLEIVFGVAFGRVFFGERIGFTALVGVAVIIAAATIPYVKDYNAQRGTLEDGKLHKRG